MNNKPQRQDSLSDQLRDLSYIADKEGMYDASTYLRDRDKKLEILESELKELKGLLKKIHEKFDTGDLWQEIENILN